MISQFHKLGQKKDMIYIMKNKMKWLSILIVGFFIFTGCAINEESNEMNVEVFSLRELMPGLNEDEDPTLYLVAPEEEPDKVGIYTSVMVNGVGESIEEIYDLEGVTVTDDEIIIQYEGQKDHFERLSESVAENENSIQYHYEEE